MSHIYFYLSLFFLPLIPHFVLQAFQHSLLPFVSEYLYILGFCILLHV
jgi:hypothetical protein